MSEGIMLRGAEPRKILQIVIEKKIPAIMSYLAEGKWHAVRVLLTGLGATQFDVEVSTPSCELPNAKDDRAAKSKMGTRKPYLINIQVGQPVGISLKYGYGKFVFDAAVTGFEPSSGPTGGGKIVLALPDRIEIVQRRSYFRINVPKSLKVKVVLWHRCYKSEDRECNKEQMPPQRYWQGRLVDISAGGAQVAIDVGQKPDFRKAQFVGLQFTPMPYETPLMFNAQIRNILPTADGSSACLGLQMVGLEASPEGRSVLQRLCNVVERYYQINQSGVKQQDFQTTSS